MAAFRNTTSNTRAVNIGTAKPVTFPAGLPVFVSDVEEKLLVEHPTFKDWGKRGFIETVTGKAKIDTASDFVDAVNDVKEPKNGATPKKGRVKGKKIELENVGEAE